MAMTWYLLGFIISNISPLLFNCNDDIRINVAVIGLSMKKLFFVGNGVNEML